MEWGFRQHTDGDIARIRLRRGTHASRSLGNDHIARPIEGAVPPSVTKECSLFLIKTWSITCIVRTGPLLQDGAVAVYHRHRTSIALGSRISIVFLDPKHVSSLASSHSLYLLTISVNGREQDIVPGDTVAEVDYGPRIRDVRREYRSRHDLYPLFDL